MKRLYYTHHDSRTLKLAIEGDVSDNANIFTVIVGKNGVGKSRLLSQIAKDCIQDIHFLKTFNPLFDREITPKLIAVSTSPFDKFPPGRRSLNHQRKENNYRYVGMRGEGPFGVSNAVSLLSSAARGWLEKLAYSENPANLLDVFHSIDFEPHIEFVFKPTYNGPDTPDYNFIGVYSDEILTEVKELYLKYNIKIDRKNIESLLKLNSESRHDIYEALVEINRFEPERRAVTLSVDFTNGETLVGSTYANNYFSRSILKLMNAGFMRLMDMRLIKKSYGPMSLKRASSGEQCLLVMLLGIAGHITDGSIILIDEPEISLHLRWQEEFIIMLTKAFLTYSGCQFIIATHSPQIISNLPNKGCYITSLSKSYLYKAKYFSNRSADYQLAELFDAPGIMNEYIARLAFNLLSKVKTAKLVTDDNWRELKQLQLLLENVNSNDPINELVNSVSQVCEIYAKN
ncbi:TPA: ATP-binding protein [Escherichia coli]|nr:ATP-binding protein [Escherichia coli]